LKGVFPLSLTLKGKAAGSCRHVEARNEEIKGKYDGTRRHSYDVNMVCINYLLVAENKE
jgi:hypothetical protein